MLHARNATDINSIETTKGQQPGSVMGPLAIFWDIENCPVPGEANAENVAANLRMALRVHPAVRGSVTLFSAYGDFNHFPRKVREGCQRTGVNLIDVPNGKKDASDKAILVDMFLFCLDNPPPCTVFLISGDVDFASALHKLGQRGYNIVLAIPTGAAVASALCSAGRYVWDWPSVARGEGLVPAKAFQSHEPFYAGIEIRSCFTRQRTGFLASDDSDQSKDEFVFPEFSRNLNAKNNGRCVPWNRDLSSNHVESEKCKNLNGEGTKAESSFHCYQPSSVAMNTLEPNPRVSFDDYALPQSCQRVEAAAQSSSFEKSYLLDGTIEGDHEEQVEGVERMSLEENSQTSWVFPGDLQGLKRQIVKLISLHGGRLKLLCLPAEYRKTFGRPLYLAEYKCAKLSDLMEKMQDFVLIKGKGTSRTLQLTKAGARFVWDTCTSERIVKENSSIEVSMYESPQKGCRHVGSGSSFQKLDTSQGVSGSSPDSDSTSADEKNVDQEDAADLEIQRIGVCAEEHEAGSRLAAFKPELQELLVSHACKIPTSNFLALYQLKYARHLDYRALGFQSMESLFEKVQDVAILKEEEGLPGKFLVARCAMHLNSM